MGRDKVFQKVNEIFQEVFEDDELVVNSDTTAADIDEWDSLMHLSLINEIEVEFGIKFTMGEIQGSKNVGELFDALVKHIEEK